MNTHIYKIIDVLLDFFFPKEESIAKLEGLAQKGLLHTLPLSEPSPHAFINPLFDYKNRDVRNLVWAIKYRGNTTLASNVGTLMYEHIIGELGEKILFDNSTNLLLVPIPIGKTRRAKRGFNQAELLASKIKDHDAENILKYKKDLIIKTKDTSPQTKLTRKNRLLNLENCFAARNDPELKDSTVILIDDVSTTGATIAEARKTLVQSGAKKVIAFTIAH